MFYWALKILFGWVVKLIWIKRVEGLDNIPKNGPYIIAANHCSYFDFIALIAVLPKRIYFLAAEKFYKSAFWYPLVAWTGQIKVDRKSSDKKEVYRKTLSILNSGKVLGIFPEGTRSLDGQIGKTYTGVARFVLEAKVPVVPVGIVGSYEVMSRYDKKPKFKKIIKIRIGKPMYFEEYYRKENNEFIFREITDKIMKKIAILAAQ